MGLSTVPLMCAREVPVPDALPRVIRVLVHYYADEDRTSRATSTCARRERCGRTSKSAQ